MGKRKLTRTHQLKCIAALPYNPFFEEEVKKLRQKYTVPESSNIAWDWFMKDVLPQYEKNAFSVFSDENKFPFAPASAAQRIIETQVPLEIDILILLEQFGLPLNMYLITLFYILSGDKLWFHPLWMRPGVKCELDCKTGEPALTVTVTRLTPWATKKEWEEIWDDDVRPELDIMKQTTKKLLGIAETGRKRATLLSFNEQMKRWSEWYHLSEIQGLGPTKALLKWEEEHSDERRKFDQSTITHAITEFRGIITPIAVKD